MKIQAGQSHILIQFDEDIVGFWVGCTIRMRLTTNIDWLVKLADFDAFDEAKSLEECLLFFEDILDGIDIPRKNPPTLKKLHQKQMILLDLLGRQHVP